MTGFGRATFVAGHGKHRHVAKWACFLCEMFAAAHPDEIHNAMYGTDLAGVTPNLRARHARKSCQSNNNAAALTMLVRTMRDRLIAGGYTRHAVVAPLTWSQ